MPTKTESNNTVKTFPFDFPSFFLIYKHAGDSWSSAVEILVERPYLLLAIWTVKQTAKKLTIITLHTHLQ